MEGIRTIARSVLTALTVAGVLAAVIPVAIACDTGTSPESTQVHKASESRTVGEGKQPENRSNPARERCKRGDKGSNPKTCPAEGGGERVPQDNKRSPLDDVPPLAPLVA
jgi:hypothetical protein